MNRSTRFQRLYEREVNFYLLRPFGDKFIFAEIARSTALDSWYSQVSNKQAETISIVTINLLSR